MLVSWELQARAHNSRHECAIPGSQREIFVSCIFFLKMVVPIIPKAVSQPLVSEASIIKAWGNRVIVCSWLAVDTFHPLSSASRDEAALLAS